MCGRFVLVSAVDQLSRLFDVDDLDVEDTPPNPNVAPTEPVHAALERQGRRALVTLRGA
jgi:putative SOS response-associated peptidase YedK